MQNAIQTFPAAVANAVAADALTPPPDFDFQMPCRYFKSSFARSLSLNNSNNSNNTTALALAKNSTQIEDKQPQQPSSTPPPALPARRHTTNNHNNNNLTHLNTAPANQLQQQKQQQRNLVAWSTQVRNLYAFIEFYRLLFALLLLPLTLPLPLLCCTCHALLLFLLLTRACRLGSLVSFSAQLDIYVTLLFCLALPSANSPWLRTPLALAGGELRWS